MGFVNSIFNLFRFNKKNWKAILLCVFAATVFWFFNALNKNYSANIGFPIVFDYDHGKYIPVKDLPEKIRLNVSGNGWDLFRRSSGLKVPPLVIPLERPAEVKKIVGSSLPPLFSTQLEGLQINYVLTDTIYLDINHKSKRIIKLAVDSADKFIQRNYGIAGPITIIPDSVLVEGPESAINALPATLSLVLPDERIKTDFDDLIEVDTGTEFITRTPPVVRVAFRVENMEEVTHTCPLKLIHVPDRLRVAAEASQVSVTFLTPASLVKLMRADSMYAVIDLQSVPPGHHKIAPRIAGLPKYSRVVRVDTVSVSY
ncbi:MAG: hypothetical protein HRU69_05410 [Flammeovirgaceae bacterium]|nr:MAG: hypothetical protein HRU69_05410 [Flammeovirgaceae bacterium]